MKNKTVEVNEGHLMEGGSQHIKKFGLCKKERGVTVKEIQSDLQFGEMALAEV